MNKNIIVLILSLSGLLIASIISFVLFGERSIFFRGSLVLVFIGILYCLVYFKKHIRNLLRRGKLSRVKLFESLALLIFSIAFLSFLNSFDLTMDLTSRQLFRLSKETRTIVQKINSPLTIKIFSYQEEGIQGLVEYAKNLSKRYEASNPNMITFEQIDPVKNKAIADEYHIRQNGTIVFEMDGRKEYVTPNLLVENFAEGQISYKGETIFSAIIDKLNENKEVIIKYVTGHGEIDFDSTGLGGYDGIKGMLTDRRYQFQAINLDHYIDIPSETDVLILASPKTELSVKSYQSIDKFLDNGGSILYLIDRNTVEDINYLLIKSGFVFLPNVAIDPSRTAPKSGEFSIIPILSPKSEITKLLRNKRQSVIFPSSSVVSIVPEDSTDTNFIYDISPLARMSQQGFGERDFASGKYMKDDNDLIDISCLAISSIVAEKKDLTNQRRAVIFGSVDFIDNARMYTGGNAEFFINAIDFLLRKDLKNTVAPKTEDLTQSIPQPEQRRAIVVIVLLWVLFCFIAIFTFLLIRKHKVKNK